MKRRYLTKNEVQELINSANGFRHEVRDRCILLMCYYHGFRVSELTGLKVSDINIPGKRIYIRRLKHGLSTFHPLQMEEIVTLEKWIKKRVNYIKSDSEHLFLSQSGKKLSRQRVYMMIREYALLAKFPFVTHPHMLRHSCGFELAEQGLDTRLIQDYLGHRNIRHTVHYTASNSGRFSRVWADTQIVA